jgi:hypothetical protein
MNLARRFNAGNGQCETILVASATNEPLLQPSLRDDDHRRAFCPRPWKGRAKVTRRYATDPNTSAPVLTCAAKAPEARDVTASDDARGKRFP